MFLQLHEECVDCMQQATYSSVKEVDLYSNIRILHAWHGYCLRLLIAMFSANKVTALIYMISRLRKFMSILLAVF